jgi:formate dehydrogenase maturation protein FdhE
MEESSMLLEHTLLPSGDIAEAGSVYYGWPSRKQNFDEEKDLKVDDMRIICPLCRSFPRMSVVTTCGHVFCDA